MLRSLTTVAANPEALTVREQQFLQVVTVLHQDSDKTAVWAPINAFRLLKSLLTRTIVSGCCKWRWSWQWWKVFKKGGEDPELAWRFRQLGLLPQDTLGRAFWEHCTQRQFSFPGESGAIPLRLVFHDFGHVLAGYDTTPAGEIQQGAFQAGFVRNDGFMFLLFVILHFHWGVKITPVADAAEGLFDIPLVMHALQRGAACKVDLSNQWNFWDVVEIPLKEVRERYGISPLSSPAVEQKATPVA